MMAKELQDKLTGLLLNSDLEMLDFECNAGILWIKGPISILYQAIKIIWDNDLSKNIELFKGGHWPTLRITPKDK